MRAIITAQQPSSATLTSVLKSRCWSLLNISMTQPSHTAAQYCPPCKLRRLATERSATMRGVDTGSGQLWLCRGSSQSACCMVSGTSCFRAHVSWHATGSWVSSNGFMTRTQDHGRLQMHMRRRHENNYNNRYLFYTDWHPWNVRKSCKKKCTNCKKCEKWKNVQKMSNVKNWKNVKHNIQKNVRKRWCGREEGWRINWRVKWKKWKNEKIVKFVKYAKIVKNCKKIKNFWKKKKSKNDCT